MSIVKNLFCGAESVFLNRVLVYTVIDRKNNESRRAQALLARLGFTVRIIYAGHRTKRPGEKDDIF